MHTENDIGTVGAEETLYFSEEVSFDETAVLSSLEAYGPVDTVFGDSEYKLHNVTEEYVFIRRGKTHDLVAAHPQYEFIDRGPTYELQEGSMEYTFIRHDD